MSLHYLYTMLLHYTACSRRQKNLILQKKRGKSQLCAARCLRALPTDSRLRTAHSRYLIKFL